MFQFPITRVWCVRKLVHVLLVVFLFLFGFFHPIISLHNPYRRHNNFSFFHCARFSISVLFFTSLKNEKIIKLNNSIHSIRWKSVKDARLLRFGHSVLVSVLLEYISWCMAHGALFILYIHIYICNWYTKGSMYAVEHWLAIILHFAFSITIHTYIWKSDGIEIVST